MKHHFCPCFYTGYWKCEHGKIFYYSIKHKKVVCHDIAPEYTGYEIDLYAKINTTEEEKHIIELQCYKKIDDKAAKIHQKILKNDLRILTDIEKNDWCRFILSMMTRHPIILSNAKAQGAHTVQNQAKFLSPIQKDYYQKTIDYWNDNGAVETLAAMLTSDNAYELNFFERYNETFLKMCWWVEDFSETDSILLTSDYPVILAPLHKPSQKYSTPNDMLLSGEYLLSLPLNPYKCFFICADRNNVIKDIGKLIEIQNYNAVQNSKNFVFSKDRSQEKFIIELLSSRIKKLEIIADTA